jgi:hypothetical protein
MREPWDSPRLAELVKYSYSCATHRRFTAVFTRALERWTLSKSNPVNNRTLHLNFRFNIILPFTSPCPAYISLLDFNILTSADETCTLQQVQLLVERSSQG